MKPPPLPQFKVNFQTLLWRPDVPKLLRPNRTESPAEKVHLSLSQNILNNQELFKVKYRGRVGFFLITAHLDS